LYEEKIYDVVYNHIKTKTSHICLFKSIDKIFEVVMKWRIWSILCIWKDEFQFVHIVILHN